jgi:hypothetical protein
MALPSYEAIRQAVVNAYKANPNGNLGLANIGLANYADQAMQQLYPTPPGIDNVTATASEWLAFTRWFEDNYYVTLQAQTLRDVFLRSYAISATAFLTAKSELTGILGSTLFTQAIRPETFFAGVVGVAGPPTRTWLQSGYTAGWNTAAWKVNNSLSGSSTTILNTANQVALIIFGLLEGGVGPKVLAIQFKDAAGNPQGVHALPFVNGQQNFSFYPLQRAQYVGKNLTLTADIELQSTGDTYLTPIGIQFVTPSYWTTE